MVSAHVQAPEPFSKLGTDDDSSQGIDEFAESVLRSVQGLSLELAGIAGIIDSTISEVSRNVHQLFDSGSKARSIADNVNQGVTIINSTVKSFSDMATHMQGDATSIAAASNHSLK